MKLALILFAALLASAAAPETLCQTRKTTATKSKRKAGTVTVMKSDEPPVTVEAPMPPPPPKPKPPPISDAVISDVFVDVEVGNWGIAGLSVPRDLKREKDWQMSHKNSDVSWTTYSLTWKSPTVGAEFTALEAEVSVTVWDRADFSFVQDLRADLKTPENLLAIDLMSEIHNKNTYGSHIKESIRLKVGGVEGGYFRADYPPDNRRFMAGWYTYRIFEGKAQRISLTVTGRQSELPKVMKIIESLKFQLKAPRLIGD